MSSDHPLKKLMDTSLSWLGVDSRELSSDKLLETAAHLLDPNLLKPVISAEDAARLKALGQSLNQAGVGALDESGLILETQQNEATKKFWNSFLEKRKEFDRHGFSVPPFQKENPLYGLVGHKDSYLQSLLVFYEENGVPLFSYDKQLRLLTETTDWSGARLSKEEARKVIQYWIGKYETVSSRYALYGRMEARDFSEGRKYLGQEMRKRDPQKALQLYEQASKLSPQDRALSLEALEFQWKVLKENRGDFFQVPSDFLAEVNGITAGEAGDFLQAKALRLRGEIAIAAGEKEEAASYFQRGIELANRLYDSEKALYSGFRLEENPEESRYSVTNLSALTEEIRSLSGRVESEVLRGVSLLRVNETRKALVEFKSRHATLQHQAGSREANFEQTNRWSTQMSRFEKVTEGIEAELKQTESSLQKDLSQFVPSVSVCDGMSVGDVRVEIEKSRLLAQIRRELAILHPDAKSEESYYSALTIWRALLSSASPVSDLELNPPIKDQMLELTKEFLLFRSKVEKHPELFASLGRVHARTTLERSREIRRVFSEQRNGELRPLLEKLKPKERKELESLLARLDEKADRFIEELVSKGEKVLESEIVQKLEYLFQEVYSDSVFQKIVSDYPFLKFIIDQETKILKGLGILKEEDPSRRPAFALGERGRDLFDSIHFEISCLNQGFLNQFSEVEQMRLSGFLSRIVEEGDLESADRYLSKSGLEDYLKKSGEADVLFSRALEVRQRVEKLNSPEGKKLKLVDKSGHLLTASEIELFKEQSLSMEESYVLSALSHYEELGERLKVQRLKEWSERELLPRLEEREKARFRQSVNGMGMGKELAEAKLLVGAYVEASFRNDEGLNFAVLPKDITDEDRFIRWLQHQAGQQDGVLWNDPYRQALEKPEVVELLKKVFRAERSGKFVSYTKEERAEFREVLLRLKRELINPSEGKELGSWGKLKVRLLGPELKAFVAHHSSNKGGRALLQGILRDEKSYTLETRVALGYKVAAQLGDEGWVDESRARSAENLFAEAAQTIESAQFLLEVAEVRHVEIEKNQEKNEYSEIVEKNKKRWGAEVRMESRLAALADAIKKDSNWQGSEDQEWRGTKVNKVREIALKKLDLLLKEASELESKGEKLSVSEREKALLTFNQKVAEFAKSDLLPNRSSELKDFFNLLPVRKRQPFSDLTRYTRELDFANNLGHKVIIASTRFPIQNEKLQKLEKQVQGLEEALLTLELSLIHQYKEGGWVVRGLANAGEALGVGHLEKLVKAINAIKQIRLNLEQKIEEASKEFATDEKGLENRVEDLLQGALGEFFKLSEEGGAISEVREVVGETEFKTLVDLVQTIGEMAFIGGVAGVLMKGLKWLGVIRKAQSAAKVLEVGAVAAESGGVLAEASTIGAVAEGVEGIESLEAVANAFGEAAKGVKFHWTIELSSAVAAGNVEATRFIFKELGGKMKEHLEAHLGEAAENFLLGGFHSAIANPLFQQLSGGYSEDQWEFYDRFVAFVSTGLSMFITKFIPEGGEAIRWGMKYQLRAVQETWARAGAVGLLKWTTIGILKWGVDLGHAATVETLEELIDGIAAAVCKGERVDEDLIKKTIRSVVVGAAAMHKGQKLMSGVFHAVTGSGHADIFQKVAEEAGLDHLPKQAIQGILKAMVEHAFQQGMAEGKDLGEIEEEDVERILKNLFSVIDQLVKNSGMQGKGLETFRLDLIQKALLSGLNAEELQKRATFVLEQRARIEKEILTPLVGEANLKQPQVQNTVNWLIGILFSNSFQGVGNRRIALTHLLSLEQIKSEVDRWSKLAVSMAPDLHAALDTYLGKEESGSAERAYLTLLFFTDRFNSKGAYSYENGSEEIDPALKSLQKGLQTISKEFGVLVNELLGCLKLPGKEIPKAREVLVHWLLEIRKAKTKEDREKALGLIDENAWVAACGEASLLSPMKAWISRFVDQQISEEELKAAEGIIRKIAGFRQQWNRDRMEAAKREKGAVAFNAKREGDGKSQGEGAEGFLKEEKKKEKKEKPENNVAVTKTKPSLTSSSKLGQIAQRGSRWIEQHPGVFLGIACATSVAKPVIGLMAQHFGFDFGFGCSPDFHPLQSLAEGVSGLMVYAGVRTTGNEEGTAAVSGTATIGKLSVSHSDEKIKPSAGIEKFCQETLDQLKDPNSAFKGHTDLRKQYRQVIQKFQTGKITKRDCLVQVMSLMQQRFFRRFERGERKGVSHSQVKIQDYIIDLEKRKIQIPEWLKITAEKNPDQLIDILKDDLSIRRDGEEGFLEELDFIKSLLKNLSTMLQLPIRALSFSDVENSHLLFFSPELLMMALEELYQSETADYQLTNDLSSTEEVLEIEAADSRPILLSPIRQKNIHGCKITDPFLAVLHDLLHLFSFSHKNRTTRKAAVIIGKAIFNLSEELKAPFLNNEELSHIIELAYVDNYGHGLNFYKDAFERLKSEGLFQKAQILTVYQQLVELLEIDPDKEEILKIYRTVFEFESSSSKAPQDSSLMTGLRKLILGKQSGANSSLLIGALALGYAVNPLLGIAVIAGGVGIYLFGRFVSTHLTSSTDSKSDIQSADSLIKTYQSQLNEERQFIQIDFLDSPHANWSSDEKREIRELLNSVPYPLRKQLGNKPIRFSKGNQSQFDHEENVTAEYFVFENQIVFYKRFFEKSKIEKLSAVAHELTHQIAAFSPSIQSRYITLSNWKTGFNLQDAKEIGFFSYIRLYWTTILMASFPDQAEKFYQKRDNPVISGAQLVFIDPHHHQLVSFEETMIPRFNESDYATFNEEEELPEAVGEAISNPTKFRYHCLIEPHQKGLSDEQIARFRKKWSLVRGEILGLSDELIEATVEKLLVEVDIDRKKAQKIIEDFFHQAQLTTTAIQFESLRQEFIEKLKAEKQIHSSETIEAIQNSSISSNSAVDNSWQTVILDDDAISFCNESLDQLNSSDCVLQDSAEENYYPKREYEKVLRGVLAREISFAEGIALLEEILREDYFRECTRKYSFIRGRRRFTFKNGIQGEADCLTLQEGECPEDLEFFGGVYHTAFPTESNFDIYRRPLTILFPSARDILSSISKCPGYKAKPMASKADILQVYNMGRDKTRPVWITPIRMKGVHNIKEAHPYLVGVVHDLSHVGQMVGSLVIRGLLDSQRKGLLDIFEILLDSPLRKQCLDSESLGAYLLDVVTNFNIAISFTFGIIKRFKPNVEVVLEIDRRLRARFSEESDHDIIYEFRDNFPDVSFPDLEISSQSSTSTDAAITSEILSSESGFIGAEKSILGIAGLGGMILGVKGLVALGVGIAAASAIVPATALALGAVAVLYGKGKAAGVEGVITSFRMGIHLFIEKNNVGKIAKVGSHWLEKHPAILLGIACVISVAKPMIGLMAQHFGFDLGFGCSPDFHPLQSLAEGVSGLMVYAGVKEEQGDRSGKGTSREPFIIPIFDQELRGKLLLIHEEEKEGDQPVWINGIVLYGEEPKGNPETSLYQVWFRSLSNAPYSPPPVILSFRQARTLGLVNEQGKVVLRSGRVGDKGFRDLRREEEIPILIRSDPEEYRKQMEIWGGAEFISLPKEEKGRVLNLQSDFFASFLGSSSPYIAGLKITFLYDQRKMPRIILQDNIKTGSSFGIYVRRNNLWLRIHPERKEVSVQLGEIFAVHFGTGDHENIFFSIEGLKINDSSTGGKTFSSLKLQVHRSYKAGVKYREFGSYPIIDLNHRRSFEKVDVSGSFLLKAGEIYSLGRNLENQIVIPDQTISRKDHLLLRSNGDGSITFKNLVEPESAKIGAIFDGTILTNEEEVTLFPGESLKISDGIEIFVLENGELKIEAVLSFSAVSAKTDTDSIPLYQRTPEQISVLREQEILNGIQIFCQKSLEQLKSESSFLKGDLDLEQRWSEVIQKWQRGEISNFDAEIEMRSILREGSFRRLKKKFNLEVATTTLAAYAEDIVLRTGKPLSPHATKLVAALPNSSVQIISLENVERTRFAEPHQLSDIKQFAEALGLYAHVKLRCFDQNPENFFAQSFEGRIVFFDPTLEMRAAEIVYEGQAVSYVPVAVIDTEEGILRKAFLDLRPRIYSLLPATIHYQTRDYPLFGLIHDDFHGFMASAHSSNFRKDAALISICYRLSQGEPPPGNHTHKAYEEYRVGVLEMNIDSLNNQYPLLFQYIFDNLLRKKPSVEMIRTHLLRLQQAFADHPRRDLVLQGFWQVFKEFLPADDFNFVQISLLQHSSKSKLQSSALSVLAVSAITIGPLITVGVALVVSTIGLSIAAYQKGKAVVQKRMIDPWKRMKAGILAVSDSTSNPLTQIIKGTIGAELPELTSLEQARINKIIKQGNNHLQKMNMEGELVRLSLKGSDAIILLIELIRDNLKKLNFTSMIHEDKNMSVVLVYLSDDGVAEIFWDNIEPMGNKETVNGKVAIEIPILLKKETKDGKEKVILSALFLSDSPADYQRARRAYQVAIQLRALEGKNLFDDDLIEEIFPSEKGMIPFSTERGTQAPLRLVKRQQDSLTPGIVEPLLDSNFDLSRGDIPRNCTDLFPIFSPRLSNGIGEMRFEERPDLSGELANVVVLLTEEREFEIQWNDEAVLHSRERKIGNQRAYPVWIQILRRTEKDQKTVITIDAIEIPRDTLSSQMIHSIALKMESDLEKKELAVPVHRRITGEYRPIYQIADLTADQKEKVIQAIGESELASNIYRSIQNSLLNHADTLSLSLQFNLTLNRQGELSSPSLFKMGKYYSVDISLMRICPQKGKLVFEIKKVFSENEKKGGNVQEDIFYQALQFVQEAKYIAPAQKSESSESPPPPHSFNPQRGFSQIEAMATIAAIAFPVAIASAFGLTAGIIAAGTVIVAETLIIGAIAVYAKVKALNIPACLDQLKTGLIFIGSAITSFSFKKVKHRPSLQWTAAISFLAASTPLLAEAAVEVFYWKERLLLIFISQ